MPSLPSSPAPSSTTMLETSSPSHIVSSMTDTNKVNLFSCSASPHLQPAPLLPLS